MNYYNEFDPKIAAWLRQLIADGHIPAGEVDERSIEDVIPSDLAGFTQCHFFAGIGGWSHALDLAGWPRNQRVWTGSCPCQPFSAAGKGDGFADERHLWPAWQHLIAQCRPPVVFGEQVASKAADVWIDLVQADLENMGYAFGCIPFPSAGVGAPHIRDRNYWVAYSEREGLEGLGRSLELNGEKGWEVKTGHGSEGGDIDRMADSEIMRRAWSDVPENGRLPAFGAADIGSDSKRPGPVNGFWRDADWLRCTDGKWRPVEPGSFPLAHGLPARVVRLRGYGNAINPHQAAEFICATVEAVA